MQLVPGFLSSTVFLQLAMNNHHKNQTKKTMMGCASSSWDGDQTRSDDGFVDWWMS